MATDEVDNLKHAETSVRAAVRGKGGETTERELDRCVADGPAKYDIGMEDEVGIEDGSSRSSDRLCFF